MTIRHGVLANAIVRAQHLLDNHRRSQAAAVLSVHLAAHQSQNPPHDPVLAQAATLYAIAEQGRPRTRRCWIRYALAASHRLYGPDDPRTLDVVRIYARVLHEIHEHGGAYSLLTTLLAVCRELGLATYALHVQMEMAQVLHAQGRCGEAIRHADQTWRQWRNQHDDVTAGATILRGYADLLFRCGRMPSVLDLAAHTAQMYPVLRDVLGDPADTAAVERRLASAGPEVHARVCARYYDDLLHDAAPRTGAVPGRARHDLSELTAWRNPR